MFAKRERGSGREGTKVAQCRFTNRGYNVLSGYWRRFAQEDGHVQMKGCYYVQLNLSTDYAIRCMIYLAQRPNGDSASGISKVVGIERVHTQKILRKLQKSNLVKSTMGSAGGFSLNRPADSITLLEIISAMEKTILINRCLEEDRYCSLTRSHICPVRQVYVNLQEYMEEYLGSWTLTRLLEQVDSL